MDESIQAFMTRESGALEKADGVWLGKVWWGCVILLSSGLLYAAFIVGMMALIHWGILFPGFYGIIVAEIGISAGLWGIASAERGERAGWVVRLGAAVIILLRLATYVARMTGNYGWAKGAEWCERILVVILTWMGMRILGRIADRANERKTARDSRWLGWGISAATIAHGMWGDWFRITYGMGFGRALAEPMFGGVIAVTLLPYSLWLWPRVDAEVGVWFLMAILAVASGIVQVRVMRMLYLAKKR
jgi:hypothetical protein